VLSARNRFGRRGKLALQLTSLLDMFTIILVFLMVSFQAEDKDFVLHAGLELPQSSAKSPFKTGVNLAITLDGVLVEGRKVYDLKNGQAAEKDHEAGRAEGITQAIAHDWGQLKREEGEEDIVVIQADKGLPYRTIHLVMRSAAYAGAYRFRLVVEKE